jgi:urease beta subunit
LQTHAIKQAAHLVFDHVGQGAHHHQGGCGVGAGGQAGNHGRETGVFTLGESGFDAAARVVEHAHLGVVNLVLAFGRARQVKLDDFGGARTHQEQQADVGAARQQLSDHAVELFVHIGQARQIALVDDGGAKAGLGKNHHARCRLDQVGTGA